MKLREAVGVSVILMVVTVFRPILIPKLNRIH